MRLALIGLGKMGARMGRRLLAAGHEVHGFDPAPAARTGFVESGGAALDTLGDAAGLPARRAVWLMVPAGKPVDDVLAELAPVLDEGDVVVDGGNSDHRDTRRRGEALAARGISLVDAGTSGGVWGLEEGYCLMVGGEEEAVEFLRPLLEALAPAPDHGWSRVGPPGAGHFAKMVHNAIEYGVMQAYAEGFALLRSAEPYGFDLASVAETWRYGSVVRSWLLDLVARSLADGKGLADVAPRVPDSGEGRWALREAVERGVPMPALSAALFRRFASRDEDDFALKLLSSLRGQFGGHAVAREGGP